jgi:excisionase family DNA binding protein
MFVSQNKHKQMEHTPAILIQGVSVDDLVARIRSGLLQELQSSKTEGKDYLTLDEASELLDLSKSTIYGMTHRKEIPHIKRRGKLLFEREELDKWLAKFRQPVEG